MPPQQCRSSWSFSNANPSLKRAFYFFTKISPELPSMDLQNELWWAIRTLLKKKFSSAGNVLTVLTIIGTNDFDSAPHFTKPVALNQTFVFSINSRRGSGYVFLPALTICGFRQPIHTSTFNF
jgi:hypothetical protein